MMEFILEPQREIPVAIKADVVVAGGGPAGFAAAVSAARNGVKVVLIETDNYIGGLLVCVNAIQGFHSYSKGEQVIFGIAQELVDRFVARGGSSGHIMIMEKRRVVSSLTYTDGEMMKIVTQEMVDEAGVKVLFHTFAATPTMDGKKITGVITENKSGRQAILTKVIVDATGDGDMAARAGATFEMKDRKVMPPGSLMFCVGKVNIDKVRLTLAQNSNLINVYLDSGFGINVYPGAGPGINYLTSKRFIVEGFGDRLEEARKKGDIPTDYPMHFLALTFAEYPKDEVSCGILATHFHATDANDLSREEAECRKWIPVTVNFLRKYIPGFEEAVITRSHDKIGIRESRRIIGDYVLTAEDVQGNRRFEDGVAIASYGNSHGHHPNGKIHPFATTLKEFPREGLIGCEIPYRCLLPKGVEGLLVAGRCISTTSTSQNASRVMACCMSTGQAAGTAAALAAKSSITPRKLDPVKLRQTLQAQGVRLLGK